MWSLNYIWQFCGNISSQGICDGSEWSKQNEMCGDPIWFSLPTSRCDKLIYSASSLFHIQIILFWQSLSGITVDQWDSKSRKVLFKCSYIVTWLISLIISLWKAGPGPNDQWEQDWLDNLSQQVSDLRWPHSVRQIWRWGKKMTHFCIFFFFKVNIFYLRGGQTTSGMWTSYRRDNI